MHLKYSSVPLSLDHVNRSLSTISLIFAGQLSASTKQRALIFQLSPALEIVWNSHRPPVETARIVLIRSGAALDRGIMQSVRSDQLPIKLWFDVRAPDNPICFSVWKSQTESGESPFTILNSLSAWRDELSQIPFGFLERNPSWRRRCCVQRALSGLEVLRARSSDSLVVEGSASMGGVAWTHLSRSLNDCCGRA